jgi:hypothetical protein
VSVKATLTCSSANIIRILTGMSRYMLFQDQFHEKMGPHSVPERAQRRLSRL